MADLTGALQIVLTLYQFLDRSAHAIHELAYVRQEAIEEEFAGGSGAGDRRELVDACHIPSHDDGPEVIVEFHGRVAVVDTAASCDAGLIAQRKDRLAISRVRPDCATTVESKIG